MDINFENGATNATINFILFCKLLVIYSCFCVNTVLILTFQVLPSKNDRFSQVNFYVLKSLGDLWASCFQRMQDSFYSIHLIINAVIVPQYFHEISSMFWDLF